MLYTSPFATSSSLREAITKAYRMDETLCLKYLLSEASLPSDKQAEVAAIAQQIVTETREYRKKLRKIDILLNQYDLSTEEGIALMCLAEALLRIPDAATRDRLISDKISTAEWRNHLDKDNALFVNAATWSLLVTGKIFAPTIDTEKGLANSLKRVSSRLGTAVIRPFIMQMMKLIGKQFVMGQTIQTALKSAKPLEAKGYRFSFDMLGEGARTAEDAQKYYQSYQQAIDAIGKASSHTSPELNPGISVKLSALHPRYEFAQRERVMKELPPLLLALAQQAKKYHIGLTVDAEEADRLDLSLDIIEMVYTHPSLNDWNGFGLALQAYQKRAAFVIDWLADLTQKHGKRMMVRLVKGAYWDAEIKHSQIFGFDSYPVFTRKHSTDVSYIACAKKLLTQPNSFYAQFGTHNAYSIASIMELAGSHTPFEFQCLHGMGRQIYDQIVDKNGFNRPCRIYAPVGSHIDLLGYLVRRLLENGANTSFVNQLADHKMPIEKVIQNPVARIEALTEKKHPKIPLPKNIYSHWENSCGVDLSNQDELTQLKSLTDAAAKTLWNVGPLIGGKALIDKNGQPTTSPSKKDEIIAYVNKASEEDVVHAVEIAHEAAKSWEKVPYLERAAILERAATLFEAALPELVTLLCREAGKCIPDCLSEIRETIDYCRYYAYRARLDLAPQPLPGPTGEYNQFSLHPRGIIACISPWNFPLAIFTGQIVAALVTGNTVLAKPAEQTSVIAFRAVQILHEAGIPKNALQLVIGQGRVIGAKIVADPRVAGVMFTGSTETAKFIEQTLANRSGPIALFIAETGGQNAMIVDSSALAEQAVMDIAQSAFNSAGQRCSALRVLFIQEDIAPKFLEMLKGYMAELRLGDPSLLATDIGPVIDNGALQTLQAHFARMSHEGSLLAQVPAQNMQAGHYFSPSVFEIKDLSILEREVFGPILHVLRYPARDLDKVMDAIIQTGYGLTFGIHSRIDATVEYVVSRMPIGNIYVNRNMIGAVVGVQPFGGENLSGTGPKAGGPYYLPRLCVERSISVNTVAVGGNARLVSLLEEDE